MVDCLKWSLVGNLLIKTLHLPMDGWTPKEYFSLLASIFFICDYVEIHAVIGLILPSVLIPNKWQGDSAVALIITYRRPFAGKDSGVYGWRDGSSVASFFSGQVHSKSPALKCTEIAPPHFALHCKVGGRWKRRTFSHWTLFYLYVACFRFFFIAHAQPSDLNWINAFTDI